MKSPTLSPASEVLVWQKVNDWVMESECRRYMCRKYFPGDVLSYPGELRYQMLVGGVPLGRPQSSFAAARAQIDSEIRA